MAPQEDYLETVFTCVGDYNDPHLARRLDDIHNSLNDLLLTDKCKDHLIFKKVEPWNSVRVTFKIPRAAALRLRELARHGDRNLQQLGILAVQIEGDQSISLTIAGKNNERAEVVFKTTSDPTTSTVQSFVRPTTTALNSSISDSIARQNIVDYLQQGTSIFDSVLSLHNSSSITSQAATALPQPSSPFPPTLTDPLSFVNSLNLTDTLQQSLEFPFVDNKTWAPPSQQHQHSPSDISMTRHFSPPDMVPKLAQQMTVPHSNFMMRPNASNYNVMPPPPYAHAVMNSQRAPKMMTSAPLLVNLLQTDPGFASMNNIALNKLLPETFGSVGGLPEKKKRKRKQRDKKKKDMLEDNSSILSNNMYPSSIDSSVAVSSIGPLSGHHHETLNSRLQPPPPSHNASPQLPFALSAPYESASSTSRSLQPCASSSSKSSSFLPPHKFPDGKTHYIHHPGGRLGLPHSDSPPGHLINPYTGLMEPPEHKSHVLSPRKSVGSDMSRINTLSDHLSSLYNVPASLRMPQLATTCSANSTLGTGMSYRNTNSQPFVENAFISSLQQPPRVPLPSTSHNISSKPHTVTSSQTPLYYRYNPHPMSKTVSSKSNTQEFHHHSQHKHNVSLPIQKNCEIASRTVTDMLDSHAHLYHPAVTLYSQVSKPSTMYEHSIPTVTHMKQQNVKNSPHRTPDSRDSGVSSQSEPTSDSQNVDNLLGHRNDSLYLPPSQKIKSSHPIATNSLIPSVCSCQTVLHSTVSISHLPQQSLHRSQSLTLREPKHSETVLHWSGRESIASLQRGISVPHDWTNSKKLPNNPHNEMLSHKHSLYSSTPVGVPTHVGFSKSLDGLHNSQYLDKHLDYISSSLPTGDMLYSRHTSATPPSQPFPVKSATRHHNWTAMDAVLVSENMTRLSNKHPKFSYSPTNGEQVRTSSANYSHTSTDRIIAHYNLMNNDNRTLNVEQKVALTENRSPSLSDLYNLSIAMKASNTPLVPHVTPSHTNGDNIRTNVNSSSNNRSHNVGVPTHNLDDSYSVLYPSDKPSIDEIEHRLKETEYVTSSTNTMEQSKSPNITSIYNRKSPITSVVNSVPHNLFGPDLLLPRRLTESIQKLVKPLGDTLTPHHNKTTSPNSPAHSANLQVPTFHPAYSRSPSDITSMKQRLPRHQSPSQSSDFSGITSVIDSVIDSVPLLPEINLSCDSGDPHQLSVDILNDIDSIIATSGDFDGLDNLADSLADDNIYKNQSIQSTMSDLIESSAKIVNKSRLLDGLIPDDQNHDNLYVKSSLQTTTTISADTSAINTIVRESVSERASVLETKSIVGHNTSLETQKQCSPESTSLNCVNLTHENNVSPESSNYTKVTSPSSANNPQSDTPGNNPRIIATNRQSDTRGNNPRIVATNRQLDTPGNNPRIVATNRQLDTSGNNPQIVATNRQLDTPGNNPRLVATNRQLDTQGNNPRIVGTNRQLDTPGNNPQIVATIDTNIEKKTISPQINEHVISTNTTSDESKINKPVLINDTSQVLSSDSLSSSLPEKILKRKFDESDDTSNDSINDGITRPMRLNRATKRRATVDSIYDKIQPDSDGIIVSSTVDEVPRLRTRKPDISVMKSDITTGDMNCHDIDTDVINDVKVDLVNDVKDIVCDSQNQDDVMETRSGQRRLRQTQHSIDKTQHSIDKTQHSIDKTQHSIDKTLNARNSRMKAPPVTTVITETPEDIVETYKRATRSTKTRDIPVPVAQVDSLLANKRRRTARDHR